MNILILGCSFGVPAHGTIRNPPYMLENHTEHQLRKLGHKVYNCSQCGGSNMSSLIRARKFLSGEPILRPEIYFQNTTGPTQILNESFKVDWVVWFHTELTRDMIFLKKDLTETIKSVYTQYFDFVKNLEAKLSVIGGAGPVHPTLFNYGQPDFCITSWFNEILRLDLPLIQTLSQLDMIEKMQSIGVAEKLKILEQHSMIRKALEDSNDFPDNYHPGDRPHKELATRLHEVFLNDHRW
jgi:hypothetical protein